MHTTRRFITIAVLTASLALILAACGVADERSGALAPDSAGAQADPAAGLSPTADAAGALPADPTGVEPAADRSGAFAGDPGTMPSPTADPSEAATPPPATPLPDGALTASPTPEAAGIGAPDPFADPDGAIVVFDGGDVETGTAHPVAQAIADFFAVPVEEVLGFHARGFGFGEIARAYWLSIELASDGDPSNDLRADSILAMRGSMGWGEIVRVLGLPQGNHGRNLGLIMRGQRLQHDPVAAPSGVDPAQPAAPSGVAPEQPAAPPGHLKHNKPRGNAYGHTKGHGNMDKPKKNK